MYVDRGDMKKSAYTGSGLQEVSCWLEKRLIRAVVRKSLQANLIKVVVCVLALITPFNSLTSSVNL